MALPQKHTVTAKVQVTGGAAKICALESAIQITAYSDERTPESVIEVARKFESYLTEGATEDAVSDASE